MLYLAHLMHLNPLLPLFYCLNHINGVIQLLIFHLNGQMARILNIQVLGVRVVCNNDNNDDDIDTIHVVVAAHADSNTNANATSVVVLIYQF